MACVTLEWRAQSERRNYCGKSMASNVTDKEAIDGRVYLVGAGPGDLGLVTLRAKECIEQADVIIYDHLANGEMLSWSREDAEIVYAGKESGKHALKQDEINALLVEKARGGKQVVRLAGMELFALGHEAEEAKAIVDAGIPFEIVPGIASAIAGPAYAGIQATRPLSGKRIVVTGTRKQASELSGKLRVLGASVMELPTIRIQPPTDLREFAELVQYAHGYDWIVFTSPNGVDAFFEMFFKLYDDAREIGPVKIAAIGPATAQRVRDHHLYVDLQSEELVAKAIVREFNAQGGVENLRILIARAEKARDVLPKELSTLGAIVDEGFAYRTVPETRDPTGARRRLLEEGADVITFTSSSTVENFLALGVPWPKEMQVASIGPGTSRTAREHGLKVQIEAKQHDTEGLVEAIRNFFAKEGTP
jgi:uroporphyrinogen-III synthase